LSTSRSHTQSKSSSEFPKMQRRNRQKNSSKVPLNTHSNRSKRCHTDSHPPLARQESSQSSAVSIDPISPSRTVSDVSIDTAMKSTKSRSSTAGRDDNTIETLSHREATKAAPVDAPVGETQRSSERSYISNVSSIDKSGFIQKAMANRNKINPRTAAV
jgi:hypothetical protein